MLLECIQNTQMWAMEANHDQYCLDLELSSIYIKRKLKHDIKTRRSLCHIYSVALRPDMPSGINKVIQVKVHYF